MIFLGKELGKGKYPFTVAEISCNHEGSLDQARQLIYSAKEAGADAAKIQVYTADEMTLNTDFIQNKDDFIIKEGAWKGRLLDNLYIKTGLGSYDWLSSLFEYSKNIDIPLFSSVFSEKGLVALVEQDCPAYKIASFELPDINLIRKVAKINKPMVLSTGMASLDEIDQAENLIGPDNCILLHCVSAYPTKLEHVNLWRIQWLQHMFSQRLVGFSDHTRGVIAGPLACAMGAVMVEKHLALPQTNSEDVAFSLHPDEFKTYVLHCRIAAEASWKVNVPEEEQSKQFRRSLYVVNDIQVGEAFTEKNVKSIRPGYGLAPKFYHYILYKRAKIGIKAGMALRKEMIDD